MALTLNYTALVTVAEVVRDAMKSLVADVTEDEEAIVAAIHAITSQVEWHCQRELIVRPVKQYICTADWTRIPGETTGLYYAYARQWPVVEIVAEPDVTLHPVRTERRKVVTLKKDNYELDYFAGYRRLDQTNAILIAATEPGFPSGPPPLAALTKDPPLVPDEILNELTALIISRLFKAEAGQWGTGMTKQQIGEGAMAIVETVDVKFTHRTLKMLEPFRYKAV